MGERAIKNKRPDLDSAIEVFVAKGPRNRIDDGPDLDARRCYTVVGGLDHLPFSDFTVQLQMPDQKYRAAQHRLVFGSRENPITACIRGAHANPAIGVNNGKHTSGLFRDFGNPPEQKTISQHRLANSNAILFAAAYLQPSATDCGITEDHTGMRRCQGYNFIESQQSAQFAILAFELLNPGEVHSRTFLHLLQLSEFLHQLGFRSQHLNLLRQLVLSNTLGNYKRTAKIAQQRATVRVKAKHQDNHDQRQDDDDGNNNFTDRLQRQRLICWCGDVRE